MITTTCFILLRASSSIGDVGDSAVWFELLLAQLTTAEVKRTPNTKRMNPFLTPYYLFRRAIQRSRLGRRGALIASSTASRCIVRTPGYNSWLQKRTPPLCRLVELLKRDGFYWPATVNVDGAVHNHRSILLRSFESPGFYSL